MLLRHVVGQGQTASLRVPSIVTTGLFSNDLERAKSDLQLTEKVLNPTDLALKMFLKSICRVVDVVQSAHVKT